MGMGKRIIQLIVIFNLIIIILGLTSCAASNKKNPSFEKFDFMKKIESFDVSNDGRFILLVGNSVNIYDTEGAFLMCIEFEKTGSAYAFFTKEGNIAVYHYRTNKLYLLNDELNQFYEAQNIEMDLVKLENSTTREGIVEFVEQGESKFYIRIPKFLEFLKGDSSTKVTRVSKEGEIVIFDDNGTIYSDYYISLVISIVFFILFFVFVMLLVIKLNKYKKRRQGTVGCLD